MSSTPTLDYLAEARRRGARGDYAVDPLDCYCEICQRRLVAPTLDQT